MVLLMLAALAAAKPPVVVSALSAQQLAADCRGADTDPAATFCTGYIMGVFDSLSASRQICPTADVATIDAVAGARKYLRKHRKQWSSAPSFILRDGLRAAFPCDAAPAPAPAHTPAHTPAKPRHRAK